MSADPGRVTVACDGASRGNPGPSGAGAQITDAHGTVLAEVAEGLAILDAARRQIQQRPGGAAEDLAGGDDGGDGTQSARDAARRQRNHGGGHGAFPFGPALTCTTV